MCEVLKKMSAEDVCSDFVWAYVFQRIKSNQKESLHWKLLNLNKNQCNNKTNMSFFKAYWKCHHVHFTLIH